MTSWLTIVNNFDDSYKIATKDFDKPDYTFSEKVSSANAALDQNKNQFISLYDMIVSDDVQNQFITFDDGVAKNTAPNFILSTLGTNETFITKTFQSDEFKTAWADFFTNSSYGNLSAKISGTGDKEKYGLENFATLSPDNNFKKEESASQSSDQIFVNKFISEITFMLMKNYFSDLGSRTYLENTNLFSYFLLHKNILDEYKNIFRSGITYNDWINNDNFFDDQLDAYILNSLETLPIIFLNNSTRFLKSIFEDYKNNNTNNEELKNSFFSNDKSLEHNKKIIYEYELGISFDNEFINSNYDLNKFNQRTNFNINQDVTTEIELKSKTDSGLFGMTNKFLMESTNEKKLSGIIFDNQIFYYSRVPLGKTYSSSIGGLGVNINAKNYADKNNLSIRNFHFKMAGEISGVKVATREEAFVFAPIEKINYRFVIINDESDLKVISKFSNSKSGVYISKQFYDSKKLKNQIIINDVTLNIDGVATDALSYLQIPDIEMPMIDKDSTCIVYITKNLISDLFTNINGEGLTPSFTNNYFINGSENKFSSFLSKTFWTNNFMNDLNKNNLNVKTFSESNWNLNFSLVNQVLKILKFIGVISLVCISLIVFFTMYVVISKSISQNKNQLLNLKVQGASSKAIAISYLWFSIFIISISFVVGFFLGSLLQPLFIKWFSTYAVIFKTSVNFDFKVFLILFFIIGIIILSFNYFGTLILIRKLKLKNYKKIKVKEKHLFNKNIKSLKLKLHSNVISKSKFELSVLGILVFVSTFILSLFATVITSTNNFISRAKNTIDYNNEYETAEPIWNNPLAKKSLSAWSGLKNNNSVDGEIKKYLSTFYQSSDDYEASVNNSSMIPKFVYNKKTNNLEWTDDYLFENNSFDSLLNVYNSVAKIFVNNATNVNGRSFSIGTFEKFINYLIHTNLNPLTGNVFDDSDKISVEREEALDNFMKEFIGLIPTLLGVMFGGSVTVPDDITDWREMLLEIARSLLPNSFAKKYVTDERKTQFYFSMDSENYIPNIEDLSTISDVAINGNDFTLTGVQKNQTAFKLPNDVSSPFISKSNIDKLKKLDSDISENGIKIYDRSSQTLTIPVISNLGNQNKFSNDDIKFETRTLAMKDGREFKKNIWAYFNQDEVQNESLLEQINGKKVYDEKNIWLNPFSLDSSKFNYFNSFDNNGFSEEAQFFIDKKIENGIVTSKIIPYYNYNNLLMFVPKNKFPDVTDLVPKNNLQVALDRKKDFTSTDISSNDIKQNWYGEISDDNVPDYVKQEWGDNSDTYFWIAPYNLSYNVNFTNENGEVKALDIISDKLATWMDDVVNNYESPIEIKNDFVDVPNIKHVNLKMIGTLDTYDSNLNIVDQNLLNLAKGYSLNEIVTEPIESKGETLRSYQSGTVNVEVYDKKDYHELLSNQNLNSLESEGYVVPSYFNAKLSKVDEPLNLTSGLAGSLNNSSGIGMLFKDGISNVKSSYKKVDLVSMKLKTVANISDIALSIAVFVISGVILICTLIIFILSEIFTSKYFEMIKMLKVMGYKKSEIIFITMMPQFVVFTLFLIAAIISAYFIAKYPLTLFEKLQLQIRVDISALILIGIGLVQILIYILGNIWTLKKIASEKITHQKF
jgi:putative ABC transport system permease protein